MKNKQNLTSSLIYACVMSMLSILLGNAQNMRVDVYGGSTVSDGDSVTMSSGSYQWFTIESTRGDCGNVRIEDIVLSNNTDFSIGTYYYGWYRPIPVNLKASYCYNGVKTLWFYIINNTGNCSATTNVTIENNRDPDFNFTFSMGTSPEIFVTGGNPQADVNHNATPTDINGTYFGVVDEGASVTRRFTLSNIGTCALDISSITSNNGDFTISSPVSFPYTGMASLSGIYIDVTFTGPAATGTQSAEISIDSNDPDTDPFIINVSAEMFNYNIPGPGGITANFRLWLKSTRGITKTGSAVTNWLDVGTNLKSATADSGNEPTYVDSAADNINFNPVIKFENDGGANNQFMYNTSNGFYTEDIFIVMVPDATMTSASAKNTIFAGAETVNINDVTGIGFGDYSLGLTNETLSYNQGIPLGTYYGTADSSASYSNPGIINVTNNALSSPTGQEILYNSSVISTASSGLFTNLTAGSQYAIGGNIGSIGSLNGRIAEIFTFATKLGSADRQKIESYLAIKYGITLGGSAEALKNYVSSFGTTVWDITANSGFNYDVAGIGRDDGSDLNQKQSKSVNRADEVTIGLQGVFDTNTENPNEFHQDGDFLIWGNNNGPYAGSSTNTVNITSSLTTSLTRIDRKWKIVESIETVGDVENVYISIPTSAFSSFTKLATEEYALIVSDNANFTDADIIDVIPLKSDGGTNLETWYHFNGTKFFTFGKVSQFTEDHSISLGVGDYLAGESLLNLNSEAFTLSSWIKCASVASNRTIISKGEKLQIRLNTTGHVEVFIDDAVTPKYTSNMDVDDGKWHHTTFVYDSGTILLYVDGVLDKSISNIVHPSPNFNRFIIGAVFDDVTDIVSNSLQGEIDEVYVWDFGLSAAQVKYLMNQEVEKNGSGFVQGTILPYDAASNALIALPWANLRAYYNFNSFYGSTTEGLTDNRFFLRLNYLDKDKELVDDQTAPLPYITANGGATWDTPSTWSNSADQVIPNSLSLDGTTVIDWNIVQIEHDISSGDRDISLLGLVMADGTLEIADPVTTFPAEDNTGQALLVSNYLELDGVIDLVGESQLIQLEGSIIDADSGGYIERDQQGTENAYNYNYWTSSVGPITGNASARGTGVTAPNANYTILEAVKNGSDSDGYADLGFDSSANAGTVPPPGLNRTISTYWLYKFYGDENDYNAWAQLTELTPIAAGEGFTMKGTRGAAPLANEQNYVFKGLPYNGDVTLTLDKTSGDVERLVGNPYPSAIDATEFILDNLSIADGGNNTTGTVINGALYFWDHFGKIDSHNLGEYVGGYATRNLTGGAAAISNDVRTANTGVSGTKVPGQYIPVNQGFFVSTKVEAGLLDEFGVQIDPIDGGDIVFKNSQRIYAKEDGATSLFLKSSSNKGSEASVKREEATPTLKLMFDSPKGYHRQIVLGVNSMASNGFDMGYDAIMVDVNQEDMYWRLSNNKFVIQGVNNLDATQKFPLGVVVNESGLSTIKIDEQEHIDSNLPIFIKDNATGLTHNISLAPFQVYLEKGTYDERFDVVFEASSASTLNIEDTHVLNDVTLFYNDEASTVEIKKTSDTYISDINIYNLLGQELQALPVNSNLKQITVPAKINTGVYIFKMNTEKGLINRKVIVK